MADVDVGAVAPVTNAPVTAEVVTPNQDSTADLVETPEGAEPKAPEPEKMLSQSEVNKLIQKRERLAESRGAKIARAEARAEMAERQLQELQRPQQSQPQGEPQQKDFTDYEEYLLARAEYRFDKKQATERESRQRETATQQQHREEAQIARHVQENVYAKGIEKYADFDDVAMGDNVQISKPMAAFIADSTVGADVWYELGKNPAEAQRIAGLSPAGIFRELVKLESKLTAAPAPTRTPAPIVPNAGKASVRKDTFDLNANNAQEWDEFVKRRHKELGRR